MRVLLFVVAASTTAACVTSPHDYSYLTSKTAPVTVTGQAGHPGDTLQLQAAVGGSWVTLDTTTSNGSPSTTVGHDLYKYSFDPVVLPSGAWVSLCGAEQATLRVLEQGSALGTFTESAWDCTIDKIFDGMPWADAGSECSTGYSVRLRVPAPPC